MNIVVCIKQVPDTADVQIDPQTNTLIRQGIKNIINPFDTYALEEGVRIRERYGGKVIVVSMGPPQAEAALREAVSAGADEAILLCDRALAGADTLATAVALAGAIDKMESYDIIICGRQTADGDTGQVGPELSEILGIPFVAYVSRVEEIDGGRMRVQRMIEEGHEVIEMPLPGVITVTKEINVPRLPSLRGLAKAKSVEISTWTIQDMDIDKDDVGLAGSATRVIKIFSPQRVQCSEMLEGNLDEQLESLIERLRESKIL